MKMYVSSNYEGAEDDDSSNEAGVVNKYPNGEVHIAFPSCVV